MQAGPHTVNVSLKIEKHCCQLQYLWTSLTWTPDSAFLISSSPSEGDSSIAAGLRFNMVSVHTLHPVIQMNLQTHQHHGSNTCGAVAVPAADRNQTESTESAETSFLLPWLPDLSTHLFACSIASYISSQQLLSLYAVPFASGMSFTGPGVQTAS